MDFNIKKKPCEITHKFRLGDKVKIVREIEYHQVASVFTMHEINGDHHDEFLSATRIGETFVVNSIFIVDSMAYYCGPDDHIYDGGLAVPEINLELVSSENKLEHSYDGGTQNFIDSYDKLLKEHLSALKEFNETNEKLKKIQEVLNKN